MSFMEGNIENHYWGIDYNCGDKAAVRELVTVIKIG